MSTFELKKNTFSGDNEKKSQQDIDIAFCSEASLSRYQLVCRISNGHKVSNAFLSFNNQPCIFFLREKSWLKCPLRMVLSLRKMNSMCTKAKTQLQYEHNLHKKLC